MNCLVTGDDSVSAVQEISKFCKVNIVADAAGDQSLLTNSQAWNIAQSADFFYIVDDDQSSGIGLNDQFPFGRIPPEQPLVCDMTGSLFTKPIDWARYGMVFSGAEKHSAAGASCITVVRRDLIGKHAPNTPAMLAWASYHEQPSSFPNTPNTWGVYMCGLNLDYMLNQGGLGEMQARALARSGPLYDFVDASRGFYSNAVPEAFRSRSNIVFKTKSSALDLVRQAEEYGFVGLILREENQVQVTLNNHTPFEAIYALIAIMDEFMTRNTATATSKAC